MTCACVGACKCQQASTYSIMNYCTGFSNGQSAFAFLDKPIKAFGSISSNTCKEKIEESKQEIALAETQQNKKKKSKDNSKFIENLNRKLRELGLKEKAAENIENELDKIDITAGSDNKENMPQDEDGQTKHKNGTVEENGVDESVADKLKSDKLENHAKVEEKLQSNEKPERQRSKDQRSILEFVNKSSEKK